MIKLQLPLANANNGKTPVEERFWAKVMPVTESGCWLWVGSRRATGYGQFYLQGKCRLAYQVAYEIWKGAIPKGAWVLHTCDVPACVNPANLYLGTPADNARDRDTRGRFVAHSSKLTAEDAQHIRSVGYAGTKRQPGNIMSLAKKHGVSRGAITDIIKGRTWKKA